MAVFQYLLKYTWIFIRGFWLIIAGAVARITSAPIGNGSAWGC